MSNLNLNNLTGIRTLGKEQFEILYRISQMLNDTQWNIKKCSEILGIDRSTLYSKIKRYELKKPD